MTRLVGLASVSAFFGGSAAKGSGEVQQREEEKMKPD